MSRRLLYPEYDVLTSQFRRLMFAACVASHRYVPVVFLEGDLIPNSPERRRIVTGAIPKFRTLTIRGRVDQLPMEA